MLWIHEQFTWHNYSFNHRRGHKVLIYCNRFSLMDLKAAGWDQAQFVSPRQRPSGQQETERRLHSIGEPSRYQHAMWLQRTPPEGFANHHVAFCRMMAMDLSAESVPKVVQHLVQHLVDVSHIHQWDFSELGRFVSMSNVKNTLNFIHLIYSNDPKHQRTSSVNLLSSYITRETASNQQAVTNNKQ